MIPVTPPVPENVAPANWGMWLARIARTVNLLLRGRVPATVTLTPNATSTTLVDDRIGLFSGVLLEAQTASAAAACIGGLYVVPGSGEAVITHPANAATDQRFTVLIVG